MILDCPLPGDANLKKQGDPLARDVELSTFETRKREVTAALRRPRRPLIAVSDRSLQLAEDALRFYRLFNVNASVISDAEIQNALDTLGFLRAETRPTGEALFEHVYPDQGEVE